MRLSLGKFNARQGFDAGQYIQHNRAKGEWPELLFPDVGQVRTDVERARGRTHDPTEGLDEARRRGPNV